VWRVIHVRKKVNPHSSFIIRHLFNIVDVQPSRVNCSEFWPLKFTAHLPSRLQQCGAINGNDPSEKETPEMHVIGFHVHWVSSPAICIASQQHSSITKTDHQDRLPKQITKTDRQNRSPRPIAKADHQDRSPKQITKTDHRTKTLPSSPFNPQHFFFNSMTNSVRSTHPKARSPPLVASRTTG
jgi:hypothetical protein